VEKNVPHPEQHQCVCTAGEQFSGTQFTGRLRSPGSHGVTKAGGGPRGCPR